MLVVGYLPRGHWCHLPAISVHSHSRVDNLWSELASATQILTSCRTTYSKQFTIVLIGGTLWLVLQLRILYEWRSPIVELVGTLAGLGYWLTEVFKVVLLVSRV